MADEPKSSPPTETKTPRVEKLKDVPLPAAVLASAQTADGKTIYAACQDGAIFTVDVESGETSLLGKHESYASGVGLVASEQVLVSAGYDGVLQWHDLKERKLIRKVVAHEFWSWDMDTTDSLIATVTGRYEAGGYKYEPAPEREPSVKVYSAATGELIHQFPHVPPVQAVALSPDGKFVAAGNLMGEIRVWDIAKGELVSQWTTSDLTSWGIIKSHHYLGGVFAMVFHPEGHELYVCGMGPMRDPMAGNGIQRWQRFDWKAAKRLDETHDGESGRGLMEALAFHPSKNCFAMAGRLFQGQWNLALFESATGNNIFSVDAKHRITHVQFTSDGSHLVLAKARPQERKKDGQWAAYGSVEVHRVIL